MNKTLEQQLEYIAKLLHQKYFEDEKYENVLNFIKNNDYPFQDKLFKKDLNDEYSKCHSFYIQDEVEIQDEFHNNFFYIHDAMDLFDMLFVESAFIDKNSPIYTYFTYMSREDLINAMDTIYWNNYGISLLQDYFENNLVVANY
ncbi:MAG: hypothetical protein LBM96_05910 [Methanobrevibacter sp.]|jgi:hypothetical protein|nr:hypothetical protein [Candidatus Methanoflexus mossambicus]